MPKFHVTIARPILERTTVVMEAADEDEAEKVGLKYVELNDNLVWQLGASHGDDSMEVEEVEEVEEDLESHV
jgi:hypothetical protein